MSGLKPYLVDWDDLHVGDRICLQRRGRTGRRIGSAFSGFISYKDERDGALDVLFDTIKGGSKRIENAEEWVSKGWIQKDPRRL